MPYRDKAAQRAAQLAWWHKSDKHDWRRPCKDRGRALVKEYLATHPCVDCGEDDPVVLDFDHVTDGKLGGVGRMAHGGTSQDRIRAEIAKCEVRCANCHRRVTHARRIEKVRSQVVQSVLKTDVRSPAGVQVPDLLPTHGEQATG